jgi:hypothetical protein
MSKKKTNQFMCSSMMLPEHREKLAERSRKAARGEVKLLADSPEDLEHCLTRSLFAREPVGLMVKAAGGILPITGVVVDSNARAGTISLRTGPKIKILALDRVVSCQALSAPHNPD